MRGLIVSRTERVAAIVVKEELVEWRLRIVVGKEKGKVVEGGVEEYNK